VGGRAGRQAGRQAGGWVGRQADINTQVEDFFPYYINSH